VALNPPAKRLKRCPSGLSTAHLDVIREAMVGVTVAGTSARAFSGAAYASAPGKPELRSRSGWVRTKNMTPTRWQSICVTMRSILHMRRPINPQSPWRWSWKTRGLAPSTLPQLPGASLITGFWANTRMSRIWRRSARARLQRQSACPAMQSILAWPPPRSGSGPAGP
jgi:hypothetical protein